MGLIPGSGRSSGEENGNPLQYSCLENSTDRGAWWATVHDKRVRRDWATKQQLCIIINIAWLCSIFKALHVCVCLSVTKISILFLFYFFNFTILYWFCHISTWICHRYTRVPHLEPSSLLPPHTIPLGRPSAPAPSIRYHASNLDWWLVPYMRVYIFQCHSPKSSHPLPLPQSPKDCSIHQCLFFCLVYRVIVTIFLNSIYMR